MWFSPKLGINKINIGVTTLWMILPFYVIVGVLHQYQHYRKNCILPVNSVKVSEKFVNIVKLIHPPLVISISNKEESEEEDIVIEILKSPIKGKKISLKNIIEDIENNGNDRTL